MGRPRVARRGFAFAGGLVWPAGAAARLGIGLLVALGAQAARAGHEAPFYPSFYPQEIRIDAVDPASAAAGWSAARVHAYLGDNVFSAMPVPSAAAAASSLRSYLVLTFDARSGRYATANSDAGKRCAAAGTVLHALAPAEASYVRYLYPVTPYHADYLQQFDLAQRALGHYAAAGASAPGELRIRAIGALPEALLPLTWKASAGEWDATLEEIELDQLIDATSPGPGSWLGSPWGKQGWYQAEHLYAGHLHAPSAAAAAATAYRRLLTGDYASATERIGLERSLVSTLVAGCERVVFGYTLRREYFNTDYSQGVENVGFDSQAGLRAAIFPRTVKLKDFPWNGWLRLGIARATSNAWNPLGGFNDAFGRQLWLTVGDPALLPDPYAGSWIANRVRIDAEERQGAIAVPRDALRPAAGTGLLREVGAGRRAAQRLRYHVVTSVFQDGTQTDVADLIYPYVLAARWSSAHAGGAFDPAVAKATETATQWLVGFKLVEVTTESRNFGDDLVFRYRVPVIDVYLGHRAGDPWEAAAVAPPWSTLPWELMVLMEEAVERGIAAFSEDEAKRRGIPWLDLVRNRATGAQLAALVEEFGRQGYRPAALAKLVSADEARERWQALAAFYARYGHFLDTNGPYRLDSWSADGVVLQVSRDPSYPQGVGSLDRYALPLLRGYAVSVRDRGERLEVQADVEQVSRFQRSYEIQRVALASQPAPVNDGQFDRPECRYVIVAPDGKVVQSGAGGFDGAGRFALPLKGLRAPRVYSIMLAIYLGGNTVNPEVRLIEHDTAASTGPARARHAALAPAQTPH